jgi:phage gp36-like protein
MYSTLDDIKERIPEVTIRQLTDDDKAGSIDQTKVDAAVAKADKEIDSWCGKRYAVPFAVVPDIVCELSADLAVYNLYSRKVEKVPEVREAARKHAIEHLKAIAKGTASIGEAAEPTAATEQSLPETSSPDRTFDQDTLGNF